MVPLLKFVGQFHPASTHLPVGLLIAAALAEMLFWWKGREFLRATAVFNLLVGTAAAVSTVLLGWALAATMGLEPELRPTLSLHRWFGTGVAVWALVTVLVWWLLRRAGASGSPTVFRIFLFGGAALTGLVGHLGGSLVYGLDFYTWPF